MLVVPIFRNANDVTSGVLILVNKREGFVLDDARKLEHYRSAIFPCVECICRSESTSAKIAQRWEVAGAGKVPMGVKFESAAEV
jgi:hypothetical protein